MNGELDVEDKNIDGLKLLRKEFESNQINRLPKPYKKDSPKGNCPECGGYHALPAVHLDYIGHAAATDRLLDADLGWNWEPVAFGIDGLPALDKQGGLWIRLTVNGITRLGYGTAPGKTGPDVIKELIGDAIRNAAMRFGVALQLWHKGILHIDIADEQAEPVVKTALGAKGFSAALEAVKRGDYTVAAIKATHVLNIDQETALEDAEKEFKA